MEGGDGAEHLVDDVGELAVRVEGEMTRAGAGRDGDERRIVRRECALGGVEAIDHHLVETEVGRESEAVRGVEEDRVREVRDIRRQVAEPAKKLAALLTLADRLLAQQREDHHKLYSIHEPDVGCLAKGKPHRPYEFGCKVSVSTTARDNWVVGALALTGNP